MTVKELTTLLNEVNENSPILQITIGDVIYNFSEDAEFVVSIGNRLDFKHSDDTPDYPDESRKSSVGISVKSLQVDKWTRIA